MKLYHSGTEMTEINSNGTYGSFLFFLPVNDCSYGNTTYTLDINENLICSYTEIERALFDDDSYAKIAHIINEAAMALEIDEETMGEILSGNETDIDIDDIAAMQVYQGRCAVALGFAGLTIEDEFSGSTIMIDMINRFNELNEV